MDKNIGAFVGVLIASIIAIGFSIYLYYYGYKKRVQNIEERRGNKSIWDKYGHIFIWVFSTLILLAAASGAGASGVVFL